MRSGPHPDGTLGDGASTSSLENASQAYLLCCVCAVCLGATQRKQKVRTESELLGENPQTLVEGLEGGEGTPTAGRAARVPRGSGDGGAGTAGGAAGGAGQAGRGEEGEGAGGAGAGEGAAGTGSAAAGEAGGAGGAGAGAGDPASERQYLPGVYCGVTQSVLLVNTSSRGVDRHGCGVMG